VAVASEFLTFLFTDIEGSTALWERHPAAMEGVLTRHDSLLRAAVARRGGAVVGGRGDGIFAVFPTPRSAVHAAQDAQCAIADERWADDIPLRVRMGVHAGEATARDGDWFGTEVNRAARVMAAAHGGQIVCTRVVEELVSDDFHLVDLGEHRLRDLQGTVHLFQVEIPGAPAIHPPLRSIDAHLTNLPYELSSFVGREQEQKEVTTRLHESRLVTIVGVGGVGKTRLALQVGASVLPEYDDGVWFCELATVTDADDVPDAVAAALRYTPPLGVPVADGLQQHLELKNLLLVLDNCEHLIRPVASLVAETATRAANVSVLATSREALGVRGEQIFPLPSLSIPPTADAPAVLASESGALFVSRAREAGGDVTMDDRTADAVRALCTRLDGIPLALELAAAHANLMSPAEIEQRLERQFRTATGGRHGALERHQTLRAAIDWSYDLLTPGARALLGRLAVCVGGFDLDAADALGSGLELDGADAFELLRELVSKSLVERYEANANTRFRLLEMIRRYAAEQLDDAAGTDEARNLHAEHYAGRFVEIAGDVTSGDEYDALDRLAIETPNIAAALEWWMTTDRSAAVLGAFDHMPFFDFFAAPPLLLDELTPLVRRAMDDDGAERLPGFAPAAMFVCFRAFITGDIDDYRRMTARVNAGGASVASGIIASTLAMFDGDLAAAVEQATRASERAEHAEPQLLAWTLAHRAVMESFGEQFTVEGPPPVALAHAEEAVRVAHRVPGTLTRLYPLLAVATCSLGPDEDRWATMGRGLAAADEVVALDRTQRQWWSTTVNSAAAHTRAAMGDAHDGLPEWLTVLRKHRERDEPFMFVMLLTYVCEALATEEPELAVDLAAIAESGAITPTATFNSMPNLIRRAAERPDKAADARARARAMSRDEAYDHVLARLDALPAARSLDA
jgi:predicted ATPase